MLTTSEKRFIRYWQDQRKGGRWSYLALYSLVGTFIASLLLFFLLSVFMVRASEQFWIIPVAGFTIVTIISVLAWNTNEKKFRKLIRREVEEGKEKDKKSE